MVSFQTTQLWTLSADANEYERMHNLFSGRLKSVLDDEKISSALREKTATSFSGEEFVLALHDPCDIRKPYAKKLENIGRVRDLDGNMINGYSTLGTVCLSPDSQTLHLSDISVFSNGDKEHYVLQAELDAIHKRFYTFKIIFIFKLFKKTFIKIWHYIKNPNFITCKSQN